MKKTIFYILSFVLVVILTVSQSLYAQDIDDALEDLFEEEGVVEKNEKNTSALTSHKGFFETKGRRFVKDRHAKGHEEQWLVEAELELNFELSKESSLFIRPRVFLDIADNETKRFAPLEAFVTFEQDSWDLRLGQFVENWGIADTYNPIDVISRRDLATDPLDPERLGELGLRFRKFLEGSDRFGEPTFSFYVLPVFQVTRFPSDNSRFGFGSNVLPFEEDRGLEPEGKHKVLYALRYTSTFNSSPLNADIQFLASRGPERSPLLVVFPGRLGPLYYGVETVGAGFRAVPNESSLGNQMAHITFKGEVTHKTPYTYSSSPIHHVDDYTSYVFGADREFNAVFTEQDTLTLTVEYAGESGARDNDLAARFRPFQDDVILRLFWDSNNFSRQSFEIRGIHDLSHQETILESIFSSQIRAIHDDLKLEIQLQYFDSPGTGESFYDFFPNNSNTAIALRWDF